MVLTSQHIWGGSQYNTGARHLRVIGKNLPRIYNFKIRRGSGRMVRRGGRVDREIVASYFPSSYREPFHPGGNSLCFALQHAALMRAERVFLMGFTLDSGQPYHFGRMNPVTRKPSFWQAERPMAFLRWVEQERPGWVRLLPGWTGPLYDEPVFQTAEFRDVRPAPHDPQPVG